MDRQALEQQVLQTLHETLDRQLLEMMGVRHPPPRPPVLTLEAIEKVVKGMLPPSPFLSRALQRPRPLLHPRPPAVILIGPGT